MQGVFITGTDTAVGKTTVSCHLTIALRHLGIDVAARKPIEQRCKRQGGALYPADGLALAQAAGEREPIDRVTPYRLAGSISPAQTARAGDGQVDLAAVVAAVEAGDPEIFRLVEGAGGFLSPLTIDATLAVGTPVTRRPLHRPGRAVFPHPVPRLYSHSRRSWYYAGTACRLRRSVITGLATHSRFSASANWAHV